MARMDRCDAERRRRNTMRSVVIKDVVGGETEYLAYLQIMRDG